MPSDNRYDDIIALPHHVSKKRPQMPMSDRAAQFSPFAALTGYDGVIKETGRLTDAEIELEEDYLVQLNRKFTALKEGLSDSPQAAFTCFKADERKEGGAYVTVTGTVAKIDEYERTITLADGTRLRMDDILEIEEL